MFYCLHILDGQVREGYGRDIFLEQNAVWKESDIDYIPYINILSAVWPTLRHRTYIWAVLEMINFDITMYYKEESLKLADPCSTPHAIKCGKTGKHDCANLLLIVHTIFLPNSFIRDLYVITKIIN